MSGPPDPTGGWARAVEETSKAGREVTRAMRELGSFISAPASEVVAMITDHLRVVRFERSVRLADRVREFLRERGLEAPSRPLSLNIALPLLDNATLEEDDGLQDVWARLLANAGDADSGIEMRRAYVSMLAEMTSLDVKLLSDVKRTADSIHGDEHEDDENIPEDQKDLLYIKRNRYPYDHNDDIFVVSVYQSSEEEYLPTNVEVSFANLARLYCIAVHTESPEVSQRGFRLTPLGRAFVVACTGTERISKAMAPK
jgi:hypothetical protein